MTRFRHKHKLPLRVLTVFIAFLLIFISWIIKELNLSRWDGKGRYTVVLNTIPVSLVSLEPQKRRAVFVQIRDKAMVDVPYGYSSYQASSIYKLGELDGKRSGGKLLSKSMEYTMGIVVNGYLTIGNAGFPTDIKSQTDLERIKDRYFTFTGGFSVLSALLSGRSNYKSDIPFIDLWKIWISIKNIRTDQIYFLNLDNKNIYDEEILPDKTAVNLIDKNRLDAALADYFQDSKIRGENVTIEVVNATDEERLASQFTRILTKLGANVLVKSNAAQVKREACAIEISAVKFKELELIKRLKEIYSCYIIDMIMEKGQAEIRIIIGEDFNRR